MSVSAASLTSRYPEYAGVPVQKINVTIDDAKLSVNQTVFGRKYDLAVVSLAAHLLSFRVLPTEVPSGSNGKIVTSEKVGDLARTYSNSAASSGSSSSSSELSDTKYGREFLRLRRECATSAIVITGSGSLSR